MTFIYASRYRRFPQEVIDRIERIHESSSFFPGVVIIHTVEDFKVAYMSDQGLRQLGITLEEVQALSAEEYHERYFNPHDAADYIPKIREMVARNNDESMTFFQQVRTSKDGNWIWHISSMKMLMRTEEGAPLLTITMSFPVDPMQHITSKVERLLGENNFLRKHYHQFSKLSTREREVLKLMALGYTSPDIGRQLHISASTAETHRRNIRQKLDVNTSYEIAEYARAFDLI